MECMRLIPNGGHLRPHQRLSATSFMVCLLAQSAGWHTRCRHGHLAQSASAGATPTRLCSEGLLAYYITLLETQFAPHQLQGKLSEYEKLSQAGGSPLTYLYDEWDLEAFIAEEYRRGAIAEHFINGLDHGIRG